MNFKSKKSKWVYAILSVLVFVNIVAYAAVYDLSRPRFLKVDFFDVGQGDSIFIETQNKNQILIDGGPTSLVLDKLAKEIPFYDRSIDLIVLTHPDQDHLFGLLEVLKRYDVKNILWTGIAKENPLVLEWNNIIKEEKADIKIARAGERVIIGETPLIFIDILNPIENYDSKDINDSSVVARLVFDKSYFLLMGDATENIDSALLGKNLKSDVIKIAHHGGKDAISKELLEKVASKAAIISVGENTYGHPSPEVLEKLKNSGIEVLRTDQIGDIKMLSDGNDIKIYDKKHK